MSFCKKKWLYVVSEFEYTLYDLRGSANNPFTALNLAKLPRALHEMRVFVTYISDAPGVHKVHFQAQALNQVASASSGVIFSIISSFSSMSSKPAKEEASRGRI